MLNNNGTELVKSENKAVQEAENTQRGFHPIFAPQANIKENEEGYIMTLEMPGVDEKGVDITVENNVLVVQGHSHRTVVSNAHLVYREYDEGSYRRAFTLSTAVDRDRIEAVMKDGVLKITLPKSDAARLKKVQVRAT